MTVRVVDVSGYQGLVDWPQVLTSGVAGAIAKATEGTNFVDGQFIRNWTALANAQVRGAYHFARPGSSTGANQARRFLSIVGQTKPSDLLILDLEVGDGDLTAWALDWLNTVAATTGLTPWLYSYGPFIRAHLQSNPTLARFPLWLAAYQTSPPPCPPPWKTYALWQHTDAATIPGIQGRCDESVGTIPTLQSPPSPGGKPVVDVNRPPVAILTHPTWTGYAVVTDDGGVFGFGGAPFYGSAGGTALAAPIITASVTATGKGYILLGRDGGVFCFGDAAYEGNVSYRG